MAQAQFGKCSQIERLAPGVQDEKRELSPEDGVTVDVRDAIGWFTQTLVISQVPHTSLTSPGSVIPAEKALSTASLPPQSTKVYLGGLFQVRSSIAVLCIPNCASVRAVNGYILTFLQMRTKKSWIAPGRAALLAIVVALAPIALALDGQIGIHDPSTVMVCNGKFYTYGTGGTSLVSDDGWTWRRGAALPRRGLAPDVIHLGDRYYLYIAANIGAQPKAAVNMIWTRSLDPDSPDYKWEEGGVVASSDGIEDCNAIDPGVFLDPTSRRLWLVYGSYFGYIRLVELDPKTGKRLNPNDQPRNIAINCEAGIMIYRGGWYYLLATHGSCCRGADSGYNIRVGRAKNVTGPFLDNTGLDMLRGGGKLFAGSGGRVVGAGHFGLIDLGDGVQKFSLHYEADLDRGGASVLDIRPLLWRDGWPVAGENLKEGTYEIESVRTGTALELAVEGVPVGGRRVRRGPGPGGGGAGPAGGGGMFAGQGGVIPPQDVAQVSTNWPAGNIDLRMGNYMCQAQQKWAITAVANAGGYPGSPYFRIAIAGTDRALAVSEDAELVAVPAFTGAPEQLWRIEQLPDGTWRIMPKSVPNSKEALALSAVGSSFATLAKFDGGSEKQRWLLRTP